MALVYISLLFLFSTATHLDAHFRSQITVIQTMLPGSGYQEDSVYTNDCINVRYKNVATRIELRKWKSFRIVLFSTPCGVNYAQEIRHEPLYKPIVVNRKPICSFAIEDSVKGEVKVAFEGNTRRTEVVSESSVCVNIGSHRDPSYCFPNAVNFTSPTYNGVQLFSGTGCYDKIQTVHGRTNLVDLTLERVQVRSFMIVEDY